MINAIKRIYRHLGDELSRKIFLARLMYSITGDGVFLRDIVRINPVGAWFIDKLEKARSEAKEIVIYGAGNFGVMIDNVYGGGCFVDRDAESINKYRSINAKKVYPPSWLLGHTNALVILSFQDSVSGRAATKSVSMRLIEAGVSEDNICGYAELNRNATKGQYFDLNELAFRDGDVFLDCGSLDFETSEQFINVHNKKCQGHAKIIAFEPSGKMCDRIEKRISRLGDNFKARLVRAAVSSDDKPIRLYVESDGSLAVRTVNAETKTSVIFDAVRIDDAVAQELVTFIKMDIEGNEVDALKGAKATIRRCRPQLAISIYHKQEDVLDVPELILNYCSDYTFYLRHYSLDSKETVLYAVCTQREN